MRWKIPQLYKTWNFIRPTLFGKIKTIFKMLKYMYILNIIYLEILAFDSLIRTQTTIDCSVRKSWRP